MALRYLVEFVGSQTSVLFLSTGLLFYTSVLAETPSFSQDLTRSSSDSTALLQEAPMNSEHTSSDYDLQGEKPSATADYLGYSSEYDGDLWGIFLKLAFGLSVVVLLAWLFSKIFQNSILAKKFGANNNSLVQVIERTYLGSKTAVFLVEINDSIFALGVTDNAVSKIGEWKTNEIELPAKIISEGFVSQLKRMLNSETDGAK